MKIKLNIVNGQVMKILMLMNSTITTPNRCKDSLTHPSVFDQGSQIIRRSTRIKKPVHRLIEEF